MTDHELARIAEAAEARVWKDAVRSAPPELAERLGLSIVPVAGGIALIAASVTSVLYNRAFGFDEPIDEATLDRAIALYRRDAPFSIQPCPLLQPREIDGWLERRGLVSRFPWVRWVRDASEAPPAATDLAIRRIGPEHARTFAELALSIFTNEPRDIIPWVEVPIGRRGWGHYIAFDGETPVAVAMLHVEDGSGWLGWGGTVASHRRRGAQSALIAQRIRDARAQGCEWLTVETADDPPEKPNPSFHNVARAGFRLLYRRPSYAHSPEKEGA